MVTSRAGTNFVSASTQKCLHFLRARPDCGTQSTVYSATTPSCVDRPTSHRPLSPPDLPTCEAAAARAAAQRPPNAAEPPAAESAAMRICCVCRRLRDLIYGDAGAWASLDLGALLPGRARRVTDDVLASLAHRARGGLTRLDVSGATEVSCGAVAAIACANPGLCELRAAGQRWLRCRRRRRRRGY